MFNFAVRIAQKPISGFEGGMQRHNNKRLLNALSWLSETW